jgi:hypothetical protein
LSSGENVEEGVREIEEELGLHISFQDLISLGVVRQIARGETYIDKEFCNLFICKQNLPLDKYNPQLDEVSGLIMIEVGAMINLISEKTHAVECVGLEFDKSGDRKSIRGFLHIDDFVPHGKDYYMKVFKSIAGI